MPLNKQPIFTISPILAIDTIDPPIVNGFAWRLDNLSPTTILETTDSYGTLIERITVTSTGDLTNTAVAAKLIYLCIYTPTKNNSNWNIYKVAAMPAVTVTATTPTPQVEWVFTGGIILPTNHKLGLAATTNAATTFENGDYLSYIVEGSTYTQPA